MMTRTVKIVLMVAGVALAAGAASAAFADPGQNKSTPSSWNYEIKDGKRVPKAARQSNADGSWREESRKGACVTVKERTPSGEYKEVRRCD
ncbi:hypothetical protein [Sphingomonas sp. LY160]|uniref:hypothetical protein n=2 Tax=unclassified Sphingomonas TaxID=196159 RepID=UPI002ADEB40F|nr:hypothetical protein [Sphingomonas sp. LY160]MEA1072225.1 hypothetical protein [Sphingomonas sp. LY160]